jgi:hypothetical protein
MTPDPIDSDVASNAHLSDKELARVLRVGTRRVAAIRQSLGIPPHKPERTKDANLWIRCPQSTRTAVEALASAEGVTMSAWCAAAIVERMERVQGRMASLKALKAVEKFGQRMAPPMQIGARVRWVGTAEAWNPDWGQPGDVGEVTDLWGYGVGVRWDRDITSVWSIDLANLAPESDYIGSP